jgi:cobalt transporter subunit CbtA
MIQKFVASALLAGAGAGLVAGLLQVAFLQPVLLHAELYESGQLIHFGANTPVPAQQDISGINFTRDGLSVLFSALLFTGYCLILLPLMVLSSDRYSLNITARTGLMWGIAGFVAVNLAPAFSMAPEVPGVAAADVDARQIWWFATVAATGVALWILAFARSWFMWVGALLLLLAPHVVGAPEPEVFLGPVPTELGALFAARALGVSMAGWAILGVLVGSIWQSASQD